MRRLLLNLLTGLLLLLCVAACVLWARSYQLTDQFFRASPGGFVGIGSAGGSVVVQINPGDASAYARGNDGWTYRRMGPYSAPHYPVAFGHLDPARTFRNWEWAGFGWYTVQDRNGMRTATGVAPFSVVAVATAALPVGWTVARLRSRARDRRQRSRNACPVCAYDLRATPERCPECGNRSRVRE